MDTKLTDKNKDIPAFDTPRREVNVQGMGLSDQFALSLDEFRTAIKRELAALDDRVKKLEGTRE